MWRDGGLDRRGNSPEEQFYSGNLERLVNNSVAKSIFLATDKNILLNVAKTTQWKLKTGDHIMLLGDYINKLLPINDCGRK